MAGCAAGGLWLGGGYCGCAAGRTWVGGGVWSGVAVLRECGCGGAAVGEWRDWGWDVGVTACGVDALGGASVWRTVSGWGRICGAVASETVVP
mgnify:CR=1 FL=1